MTGQANANGKREYSSTIVRIYGVRDVEGGEPLKPKFRLLNGCVVSIRCLEQVCKIAV